MAKVRYVANANPNEVIIGEEANVKKMNAKPFFKGTFKILGPATEKDAAKAAPKEDAPVVVNIAEPKEAKALDGFAPANGQNKKL